MKDFVDKQESRKYLKTNYHYLDTNIETIFYLYIFLVTKLVFI